MMNVPANVGMMNSSRVLRVNPPTICEEKRLTLDGMARRKLGPRGELGAADTAKMTPQLENKLPKSGAFDGHAA
jgi:hypothetical protein